MEYRSAAGESEFPEFVPPARKSMLHSLNGCKKYYRTFNEMQFCEIEMNKDQILGVLRHVLTFAGGVIVARGWADSDLIIELTGALITAVGSIWSIVKNIQLKSPTSSNP